MELHTAYEWNDILQTNIIDYDGFRDDEVTTETVMSKEEFQRRAVYCTQCLNKKLDKSNNPA